jgi:cysteine desulfurase
MRVYLDNAATTPLYPEVIEEITKVYRTYIGNPSSIHYFGRHAKTVVEEARKKVANLLGASVGEIFFTSGGTEANNTALKCSVRDAGVKTIISSPIEHHSVLHSIQQLHKLAHVDVHWLEVDQKGRPNLDQLDHLLNGIHQPVLVSLMHANNEVGTMTDIERVSSICMKHGALFHSDTVQTVAHFPISLSDIHIDFICASAHKFHGPKGVGFLYINQDVNIAPLIDGGSQERNMRAGTENVAGIAGLSLAMQLTCERSLQIQKMITDHKRYLASALEANFAGVRFNGDPFGESLYTVISVSFPESMDAELLLFNLDIEGIATSGGSACSSGSQKASHVMASLDPEFTGPTIRFSFSEFTNREELEYVVSRLKKILNK